MKTNVKNKVFGFFITFAMMLAASFGVINIYEAQNVAKATNDFASATQVYINGADNDTEHFKEDKLFWVWDTGLNAGDFVQEIPAGRTKPDAEYNPTTGVLTIYSHAGNVMNYISSITIKGEDPVDITIKFEYDPADYGFNYYGLYMDGDIENRTGGNITFIKEDETQFSVATIDGRIDAGTTGDITFDGEMNMTINPVFDDEYAIKAHNFTATGTFFEISTTGCNDDEAVFMLSGNLNLNDVNLSLTVTNAQIVKFANENCRTNVRFSNITIDLNSRERLANYDIDFYKFADKCKYDELEDDSGFMLTLEKLGNEDTLEVGYNPGEGTGSYERDSNVAYNTAVTTYSEEDEEYELLGFTAPDGKRLVRWSVNTATPRDGLVVEQGANFNVKYKTEFVALWEYVVTFDGNGGTGSYALAVGDVLDNENVVTLPANPYTYAGHRFMGWAVGNVNATPKAPGEEVEITGETTIYAVWANEYVVSYDANTTGATGSIDNYTALENEVLTLPANPYTCEGKVFKGWAVGNPDAELKQPAETTTITQETTIYAVWANLYDVHYTSGTENHDVNDVEDGTEITLLTLQQCGFETSKTGYEFAGWKVGNETQTRQPGTQVEITAETTIVAVWDEIDYYITFQAGNGGSGSMQAVVKHYNETYALPANEFTADAGMTFAGWSVGGETRAVGYELTITESVVVTALWTDEEYTITFDAGNGGTGETQGATRNYNETYVLPDNGFTPNQGKRFVGWLIGGQLRAVGYELTITSNVLVTAVWEDVVLFNANGATGSYDIPVGTLYSNNGILTLPANPYTYAGRRFVGWGVGTVTPAQADIKQPAEAVEIVQATTIYALWAELVEVTYVSGEETHVVSNVDNGSEITLLSLQDCEFETIRGYDFVGWSVGEETQVRLPGTQITIDGDTTIEAVWQLTDYTITFSAGEHGTGNMDNVVKHIDESYNLPTNEFTPNGNYQFAGWRVGNDETLKQPGTQIIITENITITAVWNRYFVVYFDQNGGTGIMDASIVLEGQRLTLPECGFDAPANKKFKDWARGGDFYAVGAQVDIEEDDLHFGANWIDLVVEEDLDETEAKAGKDVSQVFVDARDNEQELTFKVEGIQVAFNQAAVNAIAQNEAVLTIDVSKNVSDVNVRGANRVITLKFAGNNFTAGKATITLDIDQKEAEGRNIKVYFLNDNGKKEEMKVVVKDGKATFEVAHFSKYVLAYEKPMLHPGYVFLITFGAFAVLAGLVVAYYYGVVKKKRN